MTYLFRLTNKGPEREGMLRRAVVVAPSVDTARLLHPLSPMFSDEGMTVMWSGEKGLWDAALRSDRGADGSSPVALGWVLHMLRKKANDCWTTPANVDVELLGTAYPPFDVSDVIISEW